MPFTPKTPILTLGLVHFVRIHKVPDGLLEKRSGHTQSVSRALSLLSKLAEEREGLNLSELARRVKLAPSTAHRLLTTLQLDRFVRFEEGRWLIGVQSFNVGSSYMRARDISHMARPYLRMMMQETGETSNLALMENNFNSLTYVSQVECPHLMRALSKPGAKAPWTCSAVGKICLAYLKSEIANNIIHQSGFTQFTRKSITDESAFSREMSKAKKIGFAVDDEENSDGLRCIASPLFDSNSKVIGALSVSGPSARIEEQKFPNFGRVTLRTAKELTRALGGVWPT